MAIAEATVITAVDYAELSSRRCYHIRAIICLVKGHLTWFFQWTYTGVQD